MFIQSVDRALRILRLFSHSRPLLGVSDISAALELPKGTTHGLVRTLVKHGFLQQDHDSRKYRLGLSIYELGMMLAGTLEINQKAAEPAHRLAKQFQLLSRVAIWDGDSVVVTLNAYPRSQAAVPYQIGPRVRAYCSAIGKAVLAFLDESELRRYLDRVTLISITTSTITCKKQLADDLRETRLRGYAIDREEAVAGLGCLGAPIFERTGKVAGSISLSGRSQRVFGKNMEALADDLVRTASEISQYMGYFPASLL